MIGNLFGGKKAGARGGGKTVSPPREVRDRLADELGEAEFRRLEGVVANVYRMTRIYPASVYYHHSEKGGLFRHSLEVALEMWRRFPDTERQINEVSKLTGNISYNDTRYLRDQYRTGAFLAGLLHDVGKVADYKVVQGNVEYKLAVLDVEALMDKVDGFDAERVSVRKLRYRKDMLHGDASGLMMLSLIPRDLAATLDAEVMAMVHDAVSLSHREGYANPNNPLLELLKRADGYIVNRERRTVPGAVPVPPLEVSAGGLVKDRSVSVVVDEGEPQEPAPAPGNDYVDILKQRVLSEELAVNAVSYFQVYIDKSRDRLVVNANNALDEMRVRMKVTKHALYLYLKRSGIIAETDHGKELLFVSFDGGKGRMKIPAVVLKLSAFGFSDEFIGRCGPCPAYEILKDGQVPSGGGAPKDAEIEKVPAGTCDENATEVAAGEVPVGSSEGDDRVPGGESPPERDFEGFAAGEDDIPAVPGEE